MFAALHMGANGFLFAQRYRQEKDTVTAAVGLSNVMAIVGICLALAWLPRYAKKQACLSNRLCGS